MPVLLVMIPAATNSQLGPSLSYILFALIRDDEYMALGYRLDSGFGGTTFAVTSLSCDNLLAKIGYDAVIQ